MKCPKCMMEIKRTEPGDDFCEYCGYEFVGEEIIEIIQEKLF